MVFCLSKPDHKSLSAGEPQSSMKLRRKKEVLGYLYNTEVS